MLRNRRWIAGLLLLVFAAVEGFASAPQLHFHAQAEARTAAPGAGSVLAAKATRNQAPNDCLACRTFSLASVLVAAISVAAPAGQHARTLTQRTISTPSEFLDNARGRAPPTS